MSGRIKRIGHFLFGKVLYRVVEYNKPDLSDKNYIIAPNHVSDADGPIIWTHNNNIRIMAKKECFENKLFGKFLTKLDVVPVDRDKKNGTEIREAIRYLSKDEKHLFMLFPQGTISDINKNAITRIRRGAFYLSATTNTPIIPVFIEQPRLFRKSRIVYGDEFIVKDIHDEKGQVDKEKLVPYRKLWQDKVLELQAIAEEKENRKVRNLKLKKQHRNNNNPKE